MTHLRDAGVAEQRRDALGRFYREHAGRLLRYLRTKLASSSEVEEVAQEAYLRLCQADAANGVRNMSGFLYRTAMNLVVDRYRARKYPMTALPDDDLRSEREVRDDEPSLEDAAAVEQELRVLRAAIDELPARCRQVFVMHRLKQMTQNEISKELGISRQMVERHLARAIARCRERLRPLRQDLARTAGGREHHES